MGPEPTDARCKSRTRGVWSSSYVRRFSTLLRANPVVLQNLPVYSRTDPVHVLRARALEHMREELGLDDPEQVKRRIISFEKFAANELREYAARCSPRARPETVLRAAPPWLRDLEPHLDLWGRISESKRRGGPEEEAGGGGGGGGGGRHGAQLALAMVQSAREQRTLDPRSVCGALDVASEENGTELQYAWWRMLEAVRCKLRLQRDGCAAAGGAALSPAESLLADLLLLYDDALTTLPDSTDYEAMKELVGLFHLAQLHRLEAGGGRGAARWRRAHRDHRAKANSFRGACASLVLLQRRWLELKAGARAALVRYEGGGALPSPLHAALVKRFPHVVTGPLPAWRELVSSGAVVEEEQQEDACDDPDAEEDPEEVPENVEILSVCDAYRESRGWAGGEEEDDLVLVEREIETVDLSETEERRVPLPHGQAREQRELVARRLEAELDRQLAEMEQLAGSPALRGEEGDSSVRAITRTAQTEETARTEARERGAESPRGSSGAGTDTEHGDDDDEGCGDFDSKLLMENRVSLPRVDACAQWARHCARGRIHLQHLDLRALRPARGGDAGARVRVKLEKVDPDSRGEEAGAPGERRVKSAAKRLISEIIRAEDDAEPERKRPKKVQLPDIDEVRKNNRSMLTAQVAPLSARGSRAGSHRSGADADSEGELRIAEAPADRDGVLSAPELERLLCRLAEERASAAARERRARPAPSHCCTARRERALNAARRRLAVRSGRHAPQYVDMHGSSACAKEKKCTCCCKHLLSARETGARLQRECKEIHAALASLCASTPAPAPAPAQVPVRHLPSARETEREPSEDRGPRARSADKSSKSKKTGKAFLPNKKAAAGEAESPTSDPLQEWIRQKNLNRKYFDLNLKTKPRAEPTPCSVMTKPSSEPTPCSVMTKLSSEPRSCTVKTKPRGVLTLCSVTVEPAAPAPACAGLGPREGSSVTVTHVLRQHPVPLAPAAAPSGNTTVSSNANKSNKLLNAVKATGRGSGLLPGNTLIRPSAVPAAAPPAPAPVPRVNSVITVQKGMKLSEIVESIKIKSSAAGPGRTAHARAGRMVIMMKEEDFRKYLQTQPTRLAPKPSPAERSARPAEAGAEPRPPRRVAVDEPAPGGDPRGGGGAQMIQISPSPPAAPRVPRPPRSLLRSAGCAPPPLPRQRGAQTLRRPPAQSPLRGSAAGDGSDRAAGTPRAGDRRSELSSDASSPAPPPRPRPRPRPRATANARADTVLVMNHVNRKPIEMVHVDSGSDTETAQPGEGGASAGGRFLGLERFEDLDDFEL